MSGRQFRNQDVYQDGRVRFVGVHVLYADGSLLVQRHDAGSRFSDVMRLADAKLTRTIGMVHTFSGTDEDGRMTMVKVLPNAKRGCGCGGKRTA